MSGDRNKFSPHYTRHPTPSPDELSAFLSAIRLCHLRQKLNGQQYV
ncbi:hypothetical protein [Nostoc sp.]